MLLSTHSRITLAVVAFVGAALAALPARAQSGIDDLGNTLNPEKPKSPPARVPPKAPAKIPAKIPVKTPAKVPLRAPDPPPRTTPRPRSRPRPRGIWVSGRHYTSLDEYMYGVWRWRNRKGQVLHLSFYRNHTVLVFNTATKVRVHGRFSIVANNKMYLRILRVCRFQKCRPPPRQINRAFSTRPQSTNVVLNGNERWTRLRRF